MLKKHKNEGKYYTPEPEVWDEKECAKVARRRGKDSYGTRHPYAGLVEDRSAVHGYGRRKFNGGVIREGEWWEGTDIPYPIIHENYEFISRISWGLYLVLKSNIGEMES